MSYYLSNIIFLPFFRRTITNDLPEGGDWDYVEGITNPGKFKPLLD